MERGKATMTSINHAQDISNGVRITEMHKIDLTEVVAALEQIAVRPSATILPSPAVNQVFPSTVDNHVHVDLKPLVKAVYFLCLSVALATLVSIINSWR